MQHGRLKLYRDPVHDVISYKEDREIGGLVCALVDCREVQRLRFIRQLGLASLVFHGAEHSRFAHSMGVAHLARRFGERLSRRLSPEDRLAIVAAALLHDVGHPPFSHVMERVCGFHHEAYSRSIVCDPSTEVNRVLREVDATLPDRVAGILAGPSGGVARDIVSSQLDADRCDYLLRDARMTGVPVGSYDLERIVMMLEADEDGLAVSIGAYESVEGYLVARYHMYRLVYFHRTVRSAETMLRLLVERARERMRAGDAAADPGGAFGRMVMGETLDAVSYVQTNDSLAWAAVSRWSESSDGTLARLARGLLDRRLYKVRERRLATAEDVTRDDALVAAIREELSPDERSMFAIDDASDDPYRPYLPQSSRTHRPIRIVDREGRVFRIEERSHLVRALADATYRVRRWCHHPALAQKIRRIAGDAW